MTQQHEQDAPSNRQGIQLSEAKYCGQKPSRFWLLKALFLFGPFIGKLALATVADFRAFTLRWYDRLLFGGAYAASVWIAVQLAAATAVFAIGLELPAAFALSRHGFLGLTALLAFWTLPLSLPHCRLALAC